MLFVDMVGFTGVASALDPEDVRALQSEYFAAVAEVIHGWDGVVEKYIGDAVMAVFGVPRSDGYDAYRAVRAGMRLPEAVGRLRLPDGQPVRVRVGIATSEALVDLAAVATGGQCLVSGDVVNVAARLQTAATPGTVAVTAGTERATRPLVRYERLGPATVAGRAEPLEVWRPLAGTVWVDPADDSPLVGRAAELAAAADRIGYAVGQRVPQLISIAAAAGTGKSRLVRELRRHPGIGAGDGVRWLIGRCLPGEGLDRALHDLVERGVEFAVTSRPTVLVVEDEHWAGLPVARFLRRVLATAAEWRAPLAVLVTSRVDGPGLSRVDGLSRMDGLSREDGLSRVDGAGPSRVDGRSRVDGPGLSCVDGRSCMGGPGLSRVAGPSRADGSALSRTAMGSDAVSRGAAVRDAAVRDAAVRDSAVRGAAVRDAVVRDAVVRGAAVRDSAVRGAAVRGAAVRDARSRDVLAGDAGSAPERRGEPGAGLAPDCRIEFGALTDAETGRLLRHLLRRAGLPVALAGRLLPLVRGNPGYAEAYVQLVAERGTPDRYAELPVPEPVRAAVAARLDRLPADERRAVLAAAVLGSTVPVEALAYLLGRRAGEAHALLRRPLRSGLLTASHVPGCGSGYAFVDPAVRAVAYARMPRRERIEHHRRAAEWWDGRPGDRRHAATGRVRHWLAVLDLSRRLRRNAGRYRRPVLRAIADATTCRAHPRAATGRGGRSAVRGDGGCRRTGGRYGGAIPVSAVFGRALRLSGAARPPPGWPVDGLSTRSDAAASTGNEEDARMSGHDGAGTTDAAGTTDGALMDGAPTTDGALTDGARTTDGALTDGALTTEGAARSPFADIDRNSPEFVEILLSALEAMAVHPAIQRVRRVAWEAWNPAPGERLLDAGCGAGEVARQLASEVAPGEVVALDRSSVTVAAAAGRHDGSRVSYVEGDVSALDFPDAHFDGVRCERVLQHVPDPDRAVAELVRVTKPGGRVCLVDTDWESMTVDGLPDDLVAALKTHLYDRVMSDRCSIGRTLWRRLTRAGAVDLHAVPVTCHFATPVASTSVLPMFDRQLAGRIGMIPDDMYDAWFASVDAAAARGEFLAALTIWVVVGTRPD